ncbi:MAG: DUF6356 family protein [Pseudomonadota bacterium]
MKPFTEHPRSVGESYFEHLQASFGFGVRMLFASLGCFLHGIFPFLCTSTGSAAVTKLHHKMVTHRSKLSSPSNADSSSEPAAARRA